MIKSFYRFAAFLILIITMSFIRLPAQDVPYTVEYYYKVQWGHLDEFMALYKKNHFPILKELKKRGEILDMKATFPIYHSAEAGRWDFRYTITFKNFAASRNEALSKSIAQLLFPDQDTYKKEEQHRFEILLEHIDVPVRDDNTSDW